MTRRTKIALAVAGGLLALVAVPVVAIGSAFVGRAPLPAEVTDLGGVVLIPDSFVAIYAAETPGGGVVLFDCGMDADENPALAWLASRGQSVEHVRAVFLTHGHGDHAGGCGAFAGAPVYAPAAEAPLLEGQIADPKPIEDGAALDVDGLSVRAYTIPGHTPGSAAYVVNGVVVLGDSAGASTGGEVLAAPWIFTEDPARNRLSVADLSQRLAREPGLVVKRLAFAHTAPLDGLAPLEQFAARNGD